MELCIKAEHYLDFLEENKDKLYKDKLLMGVNFHTTSNDCFNESVNMKLIMEDVLLYLSPIVDTDSIIKILGKDNPDLPNLLKALEHITINDDDVNKYIEEKILKSSPEKPPIELLKSLKASLLQQNVLGLLGVTPGKILRSINNKDVNVLTPVWPKDKQAKDTLERFESNYNTIKKSYEENDPEKAKELTFDKVYSQFAITHIDQIQEFQVRLNSYKDVDDSIFNSLNLKLYFSLPHFSRLPEISSKDNVWCSRQVFNSPVSDITYYKNENMLIPVININHVSLYHLETIMNIFKLFNLIMAKSADIKLGFMIWNINNLYVDKDNITNTLLSNERNRNIKVTIKNYDDVSCITTDNLVLEDIRNGN